jgi:hypothetical protein
MSYVIRCYEGQDEWGSNRWLAHINLGSDIYMSFFGPTKEAAEKRARNWYENERKRAERIDPSIKSNDPVSNDGWGDSDGWSKPDTRGMHFAGKVWMVNKSTGEKKRIDPSEQSLYEGRGFVRGGPRS